jgi:serine/threonine protein kinase
MAMASRENHGEHETVQFSKVRGLALQVEQAWQSQQDSTSGIDLSPYLPGPGDPLRLPSLFELIKADLACRWQRGLPTSLEMYVEKFPEIGPIEKVSPKLIYEEYRIRTEHGFPAPLTQYKSRFPSQFDELESLIQTEKSQLGMPTEASNPELNITATPVPSASQSPLAMLGNGTLVGGHYTLTKRIGTGGFGEVWLGNDIHGNIPKAIKIITRSVESDEAKTELHALEIIKRLNHPYLLRTEGFFAEQERLIVVMELAEGSLREMLKKAKKESDSGLPVEKLLVYMKHAGEALDYLHEEGIFHRDIKPENILLVGRIAKVADFGLAKLAANRQSTKTNFAGTSAYSSPETWKGRVTGKSDQYSLAVTYGELRLGRPVFKGSTIYEYMVEHLQSQPNLDPMPPAEQEVLLKALAKEPADRFNNCSEFVRALEAAVSGPGSLTGAGALARGAATTAGNQTPVSKWNTPASSNRPPSKDTMNLNTQRGGSTMAGKPPSWKSPSSADVDMGEEEAAQAPRRGRRRKKSNPALFVGLGLLVLALAGAGASLLARGSVQTRADEQTSKLDFVGAVKTIDDCNILAAPYRSNLKADVQAKGREMAEKAKKSGNLDELIKTTVALVEAFPKDDSAPMLLNDALKEQIPDLLKREKYAEAYERLNSLPLDLPAKRDQLPRIADAWLARAWDDIDQENFTAARQTTGELLRVDPGQKEAQTVNDLATAAANRNTMLIAGKYRDLMTKIPARVPPRGQKLADSLRNEVKTAWLKQADQLTKSGKYDEAQKSLVDFSEYFRNDAQGKDLLKTTFNKLFENYFKDERFEDALGLLEKTNFEFTELLDKVKQTWRSAEIDRFKSGNDADKERALQGLAKLAQRFGSDFDLRDDYRKYRSQFVSDVFPEIEKTINSARYGKALELVAKVEPYTQQDPAQDAKLKSLQLLAILKNPDTGKGDRKEIEFLLKRVMKQPQNAVHLDGILEGVLDFSAKDATFLKSVEPEMAAFRDAMDDDKLPKRYWDLTNTRKVTESDLKGNRKTLVDARKLYDAQNFKQSLTTLRQIDPRKEPEKSIRAEYYNLYAKLGEKGALTRDQVLQLKEVVTEFPDLEPKVSKAMTQTFAKAWKSIPASADEWNGWIEDAKYAEKDSPIVLAFKTEGLIETGKPVDAKSLLPGDGEEKAYIDYVRAIAAAASKKREDLQVAARSLEKLSPKEAWLAPSRRDRAARILQQAAVEKTTLPDGSRRLFASAQDANQAFAWLERSLQLSDKTVKDGAGLPWEPELTLALAAACKSPPDFELSKLLGDDLLTKHKKDIGAERINLVLSNPAAFADELKVLKNDGEIGTNEVSGMIAVGEAQIDPAVEAPMLTQRQAVLYALKGWALEQAPQKNNEEIFESYSKASRLDPENLAVLVAKGRFGGIAAIDAAKNENDSEKKIRILEQGINACESAIKKNPVDQDDWAELCLTRSQLALDVGNEIYRMNRSDGLKEAFRNARDYALKAQEAKVKSKKPEDVWLALGNALEDLAHFARGDAADIAKNYEESAKALDQAGKLKPEYFYNAGRCRYRWATDGAVKLDADKQKQILNVALLNLAPTASNKKDPNAAEASYFEGFVHWYLSNASRAFDSFERCLSLAKKDGAEVWGAFSLNAISQLARTQIKSDPERTAQWIDATAHVLEPVRSKAAFEKYVPEFQNVAAEAYLELASKELAAKDYDKFKQHINQAFEAKHSTEGYKIAIYRALKLKENQSKVGLNAKSLQEIFDQTIATIEAAPNLNSAQKEMNRGAFEKQWKVL